jgi:hypothetical protein
MTDIITHDSDEKDKPAFPPAVTNSYPTISINGQRIAPRIIAAVKAGKSYAAIAKKLGISENDVISLLSPSAKSKLSRDIPDRRRKLILDLITLGYNDDDIKKKVKGLTIPDIEFIRSQRYCKPKMPNVDVVAARAYDVAIRDIAREFSVAPSLVRKVHAKLKDYKPPPPPTIELGALVKAIRTHFSAKKSAEVSEVAKFLIIELITLLSDHRS